MNIPVTVLYILITIWEGQIFHYTHLNNERVTLSHSGIDLYFLGECVTVSHSGINLYFLGECVQCHTLVSISIS